MNTSGEVGKDLSTQPVESPRPAQKPIDALRESLSNGTFHHATYRNIGTLWEGLWFYVKDPNGFRGYAVAGCVNKSMSTKSEMDAAHDLVRGTGISVGSYGQG